ncbi:MAG: DUF1499 domain-containing protein [Rhodobacteraceae bacterium]|nr:DUF1499 domain-containing protein [Paracoccaceae bacterium]
MLRMAIYLVLAISAIIGALYVRVITASHDPAEWHVDPYNITRPISPNTYYVAPQGMVEAMVDREAAVYAAPAAIMAKAFDDYVMTQPRVTRLAGSVEEGWLTYVQRTPVLRMPDYISVQFMDFEDGGSAMAIYSRSRYGYGDMGVNKARIDIWLQSLASFEE